MFTGIISEVGTIREARRTEDGVRLSIEAPGASSELEVGQSVAVSGVCLTAVEVPDDAFQADVVAETLGRTTLGSLAVGSGVNLELPAQVGGRLGGHIVQGHVDGVGEMLDVITVHDGTRIRVLPPADISRYLVEKGSIAIDGVSLTIAENGQRQFEVALVPHTLKSTTLGELRPGDQVNLEVDVLAKYVERLLGDLP